MSDARKAALSYLARGWSVVPIVRRGKRPLVAWQEFQERLATPEEINGWYARWPDAGVGIVTGTVSALVVLDVDSRHGGDESLAALVREHGALPTTIGAVTGGGGRHIYFLHPDGGLRNRTGLAPGVDLRADGGMVVAPPSLHATGRRYEWDISRHPGEIQPAAMPNWLLRLARGASPGQGHPLAHWRVLVTNGVGEGERNDTIASLAGHLLWHGVDPEVVLELLMCWNRVRCRPPLDDGEVARTVDSITRIHACHDVEDGGARSG